MKLQAIRIGDLGVTAIPNEVFAITGLKLKAQSPFDTTMNIELANGSEGYIPPPEQHALGGYTTWPARTAGLEVQAEPKIVAAVLELLERVAGKPRRPLRTLLGSYARTVLASRPLAYWRLDDMEGRTAFDSSGNGHEASYEDGVAFYLPGPGLPRLAAGSAISRAVHLAGGRVMAKLNGMEETYTIELWFWNGFPNELRPINGFIVSRAIRGEKEAWGDHLGIGGNSAARGRLFFSTSGTASTTLTGKTEIAPKTWHHLALVREGSRITTYLDGNTEPEMTGGLAADLTWKPTWFIGGRSDGTASFEGKISEVAFFARSLPAAEIASHFRAAQASERGRARAISVTGHERLARAWAMNILMGASISLNATGTVPRTYTFWSSYVSTTSKPGPAIATEVRSSDQLTWRTHFAKRVCAAVIACSKFARAASGSCPWSSAKSTCAISERRSKSSRDNHCEARSEYRFLGWSKSNAKARARSQAPQEPIRREAEGPQHPTA